MRERNRFPQPSLILAGVLVISLAGGVTRAQNPPTAPAGSPATAPPASDGVVEAGPIFYVPNQKKQNELVPVLDMTFDEYDRWWDRKEGSGDSAAPPFAFSSISATGVESHDRLELEVTMKGRLVSTRGGYSRVPLGFTNAYLRKAVTYEGTGGVIIEYQKDSGGYVAWIEGPAESEHSLTLSFLVDVRKLGGERQVQLNLPPFPSHLSLTLAMADAEVEVGQPSSRLPVTHRGQQTQTDVDCNGGPTEIRWRQVRGAVAEASTVLEASCASMVRIDNSDGRRRVRAEATVRLFSNGGPIDMFDVRFPPGMEYVSTANPSFAIEKLPSDESAKGQRVRVKWQGAPTNGPIELRLLGEMTQPAVNGAKLEAAGFEVMRASPQWGHVDFVVDDKFSVEWIDRINVQRARELLVAGLTANTLARFDYDRFPYSLTYRVVAQPSRVFVDPTYLLFVRDKQLVLDATLNYTIQGSVGALKIDLAGWEIDDVEPSALVNYERDETAAGAPLTLTLKSEAISAKPPLQIRLQAHRVVSGSVITAPLPRPLDSNSSPALVAVLPADNIELVPRPDEIIGLVPDPSPPQLTLPNWRQKPWYFRERAGETTVQFAGDHRVRDRLITVEILDRVKLAANRADVQQSLTYRIDYEPLSHLRLLAPRAALDNKSLKVMLGSEVLPYRRAEDLTSETSPQALSPIIVDLLEPRTDRQAIQVDYNLPIPNAEVNRESSFDVLFVVPEANHETTVAKHQATIDADSSIVMRPLDGHWRMDAGDSPGTLVYAAESWSDPLPVGVTRLSESTAQPANVIRRAWVQTWMTYDDRRDRASFRLAAMDSVIRVELPADADGTSVVALLDGKRPEVLSIDDEGVVLIGVPRDSIGNEVLLEIWYRFQDERPAQGRMSLTMPRIEARDQSDQFYWQLIVPAGEHLIAAPSEMAPVQQWTWRGYYWEQCSMHDQRYLERWVGAAARDRESPPWKATNQYLFSSLGIVEDVHILTAGRSWLLLLSSGAVLVAGLLLISFSFMRRPAVLLAFGVASVGVALRLPEFSAFLAQAVVVGLALVLLSRLLEWALGRRYDRRSVVRGNTILGPDSKTTELQFRRSEGSSRGTTQAISGPLQISHAKQV